jgi:hypothetical protein
LSLKKYSPVSSCISSCRYHITYHAKWILVILTRTN